jgi:hypothetical protein
MTGDKIVYLEATCYISILSPAILEVVAIIIHRKNPINW